MKDGSAFFVVSQVWFAAALVADHANSLILIGLALICLGVSILMQVTKETRNAD
jgi:uncharacterized membrane protein